MNFFKKVLSSHLFRKEIKYIFIAYSIYLLIFLYTITIIYIQESIKKEVIYQVFALLSVIPALSYLMFYGIKRGLDYRKGRIFEEEVFNMLNTLSDLHLKRNEFYKYKDIDLIGENQEVIIFFSVKSKFNNNSIQKEKRFLKFLVKNKANGKRPYGIIVVNSDKFIFRKLDKEIFVCDKNSLQQFVKKIMENKVK